MKINDSSLPQIVNPERSRASSGAPDAGGGFAQEIAKHVDAVETLQEKADFEAQKLALGEGNLHETAIALSQADLSARLMVKVRNKIVDAYQEIMPLPV